MYAEALTRKTIPVGDWVPIFGNGDDDLPGGEALSGSGALPFPSGVSTVTAQIYLRIQGSLVSSAYNGVIEVRAIRTGTTNDTANDQIPVRAPNAALGGSFNRPYTSPLWQGARPAGFLWQIRALPSDGIKTLNLLTRHVKHYGLQGVVK